MDGNETKPAVEGAVTPSPREVAATNVVRRYMAWAAATGALPVPGIDFAATLGVQLKMLADVAYEYELPFKRDIVKELVSGLLGSFLPITVAQASGSVVKALPGIGPLAAMIWQPALTSATTWALGKVFIQHFESGGTFLDFKPESVKTYFREQYEAARAGMTGRTPRGRTASSGTAAEA
jgi:uncharacterized protein (DUF697 family)